MDFLEAVKRLPLRNPWCMGTVVLDLLLVAAGSSSLVFITRTGLVHSISPMDLPALVLWFDFFLPSLQPKSGSGANTIFRFGIWFGAIWPLFRLFSKAKNCYLRSMKNAVLFLVILFAWSACTLSPEEQALDLLDKSIAALASMRCDGLVQKIHRLFLRAWGTGPSKKYQNEK